MPRFSHRPPCQPSIQRTTLLARTGQRRIIGQNQVVRHQHSRITGMSRSDHKALYPTSVRSPPAPSCGNAVCTAATATAAVRASEAGREEASGRTTETEREVATVTAGFRRRFNTSGIPHFRRVPFFLSRGRRAPLVFNFRVPGMRAANGQRDSARDQHRTMLPVTGLHADVHFPRL